MGAAAGSNGSWIPVNAATARADADAAGATGFMFSPDGTVAYVSVQHSEDPPDGSMDFDGYGTDDLIAVSGFKTEMAVPPQSNLDLGSAAVVGNDQVRFEGLTLSGGLLNATVRFNLDGTWTLIDAETAE